MKIDCTLLEYVLAKSTGDFRDGLFNAFRQHLGVDLEGVMTPTLSSPFVNSIKPETVNFTNKQKLDEKQPHYQIFKSILYILKQTENTEQDPEKKLMALQIKLDAPTPEIKYQSFD